MLPITILEPDANNRHPFIEDILKNEGLFFFDRIKAQSLTTEALHATKILIALRGVYQESTAKLIEEWIQRGGTLVSMTDSSTFLKRFGFTSSETIEHAWVVMGQGGDLPVMDHEDLLCPGHVSWRLNGAGQELLKLRSRLNDDLGSAIRVATIGHGKVIAFGYDPVSTVINLRHGLGDFDSTPDTCELRGPRHIHAIMSVAALYSQQVPICDVHLDLVREVLLRYLPSSSPIPRLWHFPAAASSVYFVKSDGCGENGIDREIELAESFAAPVTFYRNLPSRYSRAQLRDWHARGHGIGIELNLNSITYGKSMAELRNADDQIRARIQEFVDDFDREFGLPAQSVCIHSCQWTGARMVRLLQEQDWKLADHFCGHDPRKNRRDYGIYCISSTMPMRYYDPDAGVMDFYMQPSQGDESQSVGWATPEDDSARRIGFNLSEYAALLKRFIDENNRHYHGVYVGNWHPLYLMPELLQTDLARFYNREAFLDLMRFLQAEGITRWQIEEWTRFTIARRAIEVRRMECQASRTELELFSPEAINGLTILLSHFGSRGEALLGGRSLTVQSKMLEQRSQPYITFDLRAGQTARLTLTAAPNAT